MMYPLVRELAVDGVPVAVTCRVLGFSRQAFYEWDADPVSERDWHDAHLVNAILDVHGDDPEFGYRFITDELAADPGVVDASENRIWRLCRENGVASVIGAAGRARPPARRSTTTTCSGSSPPRLRSPLRETITTSRLNSGGYFLGIATSFPRNNSPRNVCQPNLPQSLPLVYRHVYLNNRNYRLGRWGARRYCRTRRGRYRPEHRRGCEQHRGRARCQ
jgi:hypothetical protein